MYKSIPEPSLKANYHCHTSRCHHATGEDREYVEAAIQAGFKVLGFSDHAPFLFHSNYISGVRMDASELGEYADSVLSLRREYQDDIIIHLGLEVEYFPDTFEENYEFYCQYPIEYLILGQHFLCTDRDEQIRKYGMKGQERYIRAYIERVQQALKTGRFMYVAHPDMPHLDGPDEQYDALMRPLAKSLRAYNMPVELNVHGFRDSRNYPDKRFAQIAKEEGLGFIIGVDAHDPKELLATETIRGCGALGGLEL